MDSESLVEGCGVEPPTREPRRRGISAGIQSWLDELVRPRVGGLALHALGIGRLLAKLHIGGQARQRG